MSSLSNSGDHAFRGVMQLGILGAAYQAARYSGYHMDANSLIPGCIAGSLVEVAIDSNQQGRARTVKQDIKKVCYPILAAAATTYLFSCTCCRTKALQGCVVAGGTVAAVKIVCEILDRTKIRDQVNGLLFG